MFGKKKTQPKQQPIEKKARQPRKAPQKEKPIPSTKVSKKKPEVVPPTKRAQRKPPTPKVTPPTKRTERKQPTPKVIPPTKRTQRKRPAPEISPPTKRTTRKRSIPEVTTTPIEPIAKRAKISKSVEVKKQPIEVKNKPVEIKIQQVEVPVPSPKVPRTRSRATNNNKINISESIERQPIIKINKRRLQSVEKNEGIKKKVEEKTIQSIPPVQNLELSQEERQKIEALTVTGLKSRLNTHKEDIQKNAKKADLIALLIKIETNLLKEPKEAEKATVNNTTTMTTRRRKK